MFKLSPRQVHLDFHTSPDIEGIGSRFSRENFTQALKLGELTSITIFAKCHHGLCYYPTKVGTQHPHLDFDLTGEMIAAAHSIGVRAPVYITTGFSALDAEEHPEWRQKTRDGEMYINVDPNAKPEDSRPFCSWKTLCLNDGSYAQHIYALTREVCERYDDLDGLFYDICFIGDMCLCDECRAGMLKMGLDPEKDEDAREYYIIKHRDFMRKCADILHERHPDASIFFNGGAEQYRPQYHDLQSHFELEDLPTAWGGYDKMPPRAKFFAATGKDYLGMTGKFHLSWGEFGGFKLGEALRAEAAAMLTYGARCSIGDQMHPDGEMDLETYRNIGQAYGYMKKVEKYCLDNAQTTTLGLYLSGNWPSDDGAVKMLLELQYDFDIVCGDDYSRFDTVIFPDCVKLSGESADKLRAFIARGGKVLFCGESLLSDGENRDFIIDAGIKYQGGYGFDSDYITVGEQLSRDMVTSPILSYVPSASVGLCGAEVLSTVTLPYFSRTYAHYCSHKNTPYDRADGGHPAATKYGNIVYISHKICAMYSQYGVVYHKRYFRNALDLIYKDKALDVKLPSMGRAAMTVSRENKYYCVNLLYYSPVKRGEAEIIEDIIPIYNVEVAAAVAEEALRVYLPATGEDIPFTQENGRVRFTLPKLDCHAAIVIEYR